MFFFKGSNKFTWLELAFHVASHSLYFDNTTRLHLFWFTFFVYSHKLLFHVHLSAKFRISTCSLLVYIIVRFSTENADIEQDRFGWYKNIHVSRILIWNHLHFRLQISIVSCFNDTRFGLHFISNYKLILLTWYELLAGDIE